MDPARIVWLLLGAALASCSRDPAPSIASHAPTRPVVDTGATPSEGPRAAWLPTPAEMAQFRAEGKEPTLRKLTAVDYWLQYNMMRISGIEKELGGEQQAMDVLRALGEAYERELRVAEVEAPKMLPATFTGEGMSTGFTGMAIGTFVGMITGGMTSSMVSSMSDQQIAEYNKAGPIKKSHHGGSWEMTVGPDGSLTHAVEFNVQEKGVEGTVRVRSSMTACPDAEGKVTVEIEVESMMRMSSRAGVGGYVHTHFTYERYLDDDAHLKDTADGAASNLDITIAGHEKNATQSGHVRVGHSRDGAHYLDSLEERGFDLLHMDEVQRTRKLIEGAELMQTLMAEMMLRGIASASGSPWEGGRCIDLKVTSTPANRKGLKPSTAFEIDAKPRVKADGSMPGGTVRATLTGGSQLDPADTKVKADAKFRYVGPEEKEQAASIAFESRSKRGVGRVTLDFDTKGAHRYTMRGGAAGLEFSGEVCDIGEQFYLHSEGEHNDVNLRFDPQGKDHGIYSYSGTMTEFDHGEKFTFRVHGKGTYHVQFHGDVAVSVRAEGPGTVETPYGPQTGNGVEQYTLTPLDKPDCESNAAVATVAPVGGG